MEHLNSKVVMLLKSLVGVLIKTPRATIGSLKIHGAQIGVSMVMDMS